MIEPSWRRLSLADQDAFSRLCLCRGGFTRADAQALTGCGLATLARLQQHAFLQYATDSGRYQIHEVLHQYGAAQLDADPARKADAQRSHSRHYCGRLARESERINTGEQRAILAPRSIPKSRTAGWRGSGRWRRATLLRRHRPPIRCFFSSSIVDVFRKVLTPAGLRMAGGVREATVEAERLRLRLLTWQGTFSYHLGRYSEAHRLLESNLPRLGGAGRPGDRAVA